MNWCKNCTEIICEESKSSRMYEPARLCFILDNFDVLEKWKGMIDCMEPWMGRTAAVVDLGMLKNNLAEIRKKLKPGVELMAVLKGDG